MRDIFLIFHSNKHKLLRYFPCFVLFVCLFNGSNFISNMTMGNKKKKMLRSPQTSHYERRNTAMNPSKPPCIFNQLEGLFKENSLQGFCFFCFLSILMLWFCEDGRLALKVMLITLVISVSSWRLGSSLIWGNQVTLVCHRGGCNIFLRVETGCLLNRYASFLIPV